MDLPYLPIEIKIKIIEYVDNIDIRRYFRVYSKIPKKDYRYEVLKNKNLIEQKIGGPDWVGYHPEHCGYYGEVILKEPRVGPIKACGLVMNDVECRIAVLSIDQSTRTQGGKVESTLDYCKKEDEKVLWSLYRFSPSENASFDEKHYMLLNI